MVIQRHGENKWALSEPLLPGCIQNQGVDISASSLQQKNEDTEVLIANEMKAVAHPRPAKPDVTRKRGNAGWVASGCWLLASG